MSWFKKEKKITDWVLLHGLRGTWNITNHNGNKYDDHCTYEIYYSPSADEIKVVMDGYKPSGHNLYPSVMKIIGMYNEVILSNGDFKAVKKEVDEAVDKLMGKNKNKTD